MKTIALCALLALVACTARVEAVQVPEFNPKLNSLRVDSTGAGYLIWILTNGLTLYNADSTNSSHLDLDSLVGVKVIMGDAGSTDSLFVYFRADQNDTCTYLYYSRGDSSFWAKPCGKAAFKLGSGSSGETDTTGIAGVPNGTSGFGLVTDSLGTRKTIRGLIEGANITLAYSGDTAVTITGAAGSGEVRSTGTSVDNEIVKFHNTSGDTIQGSTSNQPTVSDAGLMTVSGGLAMGSADILGIDSASGVVAQFTRVRASAFGDSTADLPFRIVTGGADTSLRFAVYADDSTVVFKILRARSGVWFPSGDSLADPSGAGLEVSSGALRIAAAAAGNGLVGGAGSALAVNYKGGIGIDADAVFAWADNVTIDTGGASSTLRVIHVDSSEIGDGSVIKADLAANSVDSTKIVNGSVSSSDIAAMTSDSLGRILSDESGTAGGFMRATGATASTFTVSSATGTWDLSGVTGITLRTGEVVLADMASNSIDSTKVVDGSVSSTDIHAMTSDSLARILSDESGTAGGFMRATGATAATLTVSSATGTWDLSGVTGITLKADEVASADINWPSIRVAPYNIAQHSKPSTDSLVLYHPLDASGQTWMFSDSSYDANTGVLADTIYAVFLVPPGRTLIDSLILRVDSVAAVDSTDSAVVTNLQLQSFAGDGFTATVDTTITGTWANNAKVAYGINVNNYATAAANEKYQVRIILQLAAGRRIHADIFAVFDD